MGFAVFSHRAGSGELGRHNGIAVGPGRGSAAGSIISYLLSITTINPLPYGLLFERFLNPERVSMPI
jgi:DNA polymerase-3 subunit alpha